jgi:hypothetical protein
MTSHATIDSTGLANVAMNLTAKFSKFAGDEVGCSVLLETEFGIGVKVVAPSGHFAVKQIDEMWNLHDRTPSRDAQFLGNSSE